MDKEGKIKFSALILTLAVFLGGFLVVNTIYAGTSVTSTVSVSTATPVISSVNINGNNPATITLTANATTTINVNATISDNNGCGEITGGTTTILFYRSGFTSSTCLTNAGADPSNCYILNAFTASSTCTTNSINTTSSFVVQYYARATDASSSFASNNWMGTVLFRTADNTTGTGDSLNAAVASTTNDIATLTAINVTTSSLNYGTLAASSTTGVVNQTATTTNAGNSSTSLQLSASVTLTSGANVIATSSQGYSTTAFTYPGSSVALTASPVTVAGFTLTAPTSSTNVAGQTFWGLIVPNGTPTGTYNGTNQFTALYSN